MRSFTLSPPIPIIVIPDEPIALSRLIRILFSKASASRKSTAPSSSIFFADILEILSTVLFRLLEE